MQISSVSYDEDVGTLRIRTVDDTEYLITNAGHAKLVNQHLGPGGKLDHRQMTWLEQYRVQKNDSPNVLGLKQRLALLRTELKTLVGR